MDYHAIHGHDVASFDVPETHRLPTVSASQALGSLEHKIPPYISTGLPDLDAALRADATQGDSGSTPHGGILRGQLTEVWGPPGAGKTALGIQLAVSALSSATSVVWIDCFQQVRRERVQAALDAKLARRTVEPPSDDSSQPPGRLTHYSCTTLPHLLALLARPRLFPSDASLVVISGLSALVNAALPRGQEPRSKPGQGFNFSEKRLQALRSIVDSLRKVAATRNIAVVVLSQCATRMQAEGGATLVAAINATVWEQNISTRLVLFRNWIRQNNKLASVCFAAIQALNGKTSRETFHHISAFQVKAEGLTPVHYDPGPALQSTVTTTQPKRKLAQTDLEVPDSEDDEDYGWADEDEAALPAPPQQWQGSEDILLGQDLGDSDREQGDADEEEDAESRG